MEITGDRGWESGGGGGEEGTQVKGAEAEGRTHCLKSEKDNLRGLKTLPDGVRRGIGRE